MKDNTIVLLVIGGAIVGGLIFLATRKTASGGTSGGDGTGQSMLILTDTTTKPSGSSGSENLPNNTVVSDPLAKQQAAGIATDNPVDSGFVIDEGLGSRPIAFVRDQPNKFVSGGVQSVFKLREPPVNQNYVRAFSDGNTFVEVLPTGSGSTALNIVETGIHTHEFNPNAGHVSNLIDPEKEPEKAKAALEYIRSLSSQNTTAGQTHTQTQGTTIVGGKSSGGSKSSTSSTSQKKDTGLRTVSLGGIKLTGHFALAK